MQATQITRSPLTRETRELIAAVRDIARREKLTAEDRAQLKADELNANVAREGYDAAPWRGMVPARETRYSERGASGIPHVRGLATRVSVRDAHKPTETLLPLNVVGIATHPLASHEDYTRLIAHVRRHPSHATLTRYMPGPHGRLRSVVPVSVYADAHKERRVSNAPRVSDTRSHVPEVLRLASVVGYTGDVD